MENLKKDNNSEFSKLIEFISDTSNGKFTEEVPQVINFSYRRVEEKGQEVDILANIDYSSGDETPMLFGLIS